MNLHIESLANYLKHEWDRALVASDGTHEVRFIVESLNPEGVFALFQALDAHRLVCLQRQSIACHFRVATNLWRDWCATPGAEAQLHEKMKELGALGQDGERLWIDEEDRLTWYRNRTNQDEGTEGLVVVLVGLNHATDQGGLADFHRVDESRIWRTMGQSFVPWLELINKRLDLNAGSPALEEFDVVLQQLFQVRPLRLGKLADFLEQSVIAGENFYSFDEFTNRFFKQLPFWKIPPLFDDGSGIELRGKKAANALKEADAFISHQRYKTPAGQKKDWQKIEKALKEADFNVPATLNGETIYKDLDDYRETLRAFIHEANAQARARLLRTNLMPVLNILKRKEKAVSSKKVQAFTGTSLEAMLQGIWQGLEEFSNECGGQTMADHLAGVHVELIRFDHDLVADADGGVGAEELARKLLRGCLGGLDKVLEEMDIKLPLDEDQAILARSQWERKVPVTLDLALDTLTIGTSRARPNVQFKVSIAGTDPNQSVESVFRWVLGTTQPERVFFESAKMVRAGWAQYPNPTRLLPAFRIPSVAMTALYFAADEDEANRLVIQAMTDLELVNLLIGLQMNQVDDYLWGLVTNLTTSYLGWLDAALTKGYYTTRQEYLPTLLAAFDCLAEKVLDKNLRGSRELLRRVYKAFLLVDESTDANDPYLPAAIVWGLSPAVLELTQARVRFLADGFPDAVGELALGRDGKAAFDRLLDLAQIHRPLAALVDSNGLLSASIKSFGMLHYLGAEPSADKSLAVQTLLRDEESDDDEDVKDIVRPCEEQKLVSRVLSDYQQLYPFAEDGLRILAVNVRDMRTILAGVDHFLESYLKRTSADWPPFHCTVMVYSTSSSPMAMEKRLTLWRNYVVERQSEKGRPLVLSVGHRYAPKSQQIIDLLKQEQRRYDIAFLFHFLRDGLTCRAIAALPFEFQFAGRAGAQFPIAEYPRPIQDGDRYRRQSLLSNRRLRVQTRHADLSAKLCYDGGEDRDHLIVGHVNYAPWVPLIETLHQSAHWVACVDPFVDKRLLCSEDGMEQRKIVGFTSGLGAYGELNLTLSTEQDTLKQLTDQVSAKLTGLLPFAQTDGFEVMAARVVSTAEKVIGLSSLRAVVGSDERIREVVGFAAIHRALASPPGQMTQILPVDSLSHWFLGSEVTLRPDLLQLTLEVRPDDLPLVHAVVVECKLAQLNPIHLAKAIEQVQEGLRHLTGLLAPERDDLRRLGFDRRYWWAQLHRAMTSRSVVNLTEQELLTLDHALERLAEGQFEIRWQGVIFTFWTDVAGPLPVITPLTLSPLAIEPPFKIPAGFAVRHVALGYEGLTALFAEVRPSPLLQADGHSIDLRSDFAGVQALTATRSQSQSTVVLVPSEQNSDATHAAPTELIPTNSETPLLAAVAPTQLFSEAHASEQAVPIIAPETPPDISPTVAAIAVAKFPLPKSILIGTRNNGEPAYWHFGDPRLDNRHMLIFGASGSGKTYGIQCLLAEMAQQHLRSLIVDYTDGFLPQQVEPRFSSVAVPKNHFVISERLPLNPFRRQRQIIDPSIPAIEESPYQVATRITSIFTSIFATMGDQQSATLIRVLQAGIEDNAGFVLDDLLVLLRADSQNGESLANKLEPLIKSEPFRTINECSAWEAMLGSPVNWVHVLQLKGLARDIQKMVTEFALWDLWDYAQNTGSKDRPIPIVLDEIQNLDHSSDSPIDKMLREGRKFGLALMLATQTTSQFNQEQRDRLFQAGHKLIFKPATTEIERFAQLLSQSPAGLSKGEWGQRLANLEKGQCWSLGRVLKSGGTFKEEAVLVSVTSLENRNFGI